MKIDYTISEIYPNIFEIVVDNNYDLSMLFWRAQEYYESNNSSFRGKKYSVWNYMKWYTMERGSFSYAVDWQGFNIPLDVIKKCYAWSPEETPYDVIMRDIIQEINDMKKDNDPAYIIGFCSDDEKTYLHELCHGLYYTNVEYKAQMEEITNKIPKRTYNSLKKELIKKGYDSSVINDEIQAYMATEPMLYFPNISKTVKKEIHKKYKKVLKSYLKTP